jgi:hypothetical protein
VGPIARVVQDRARVKRFGNHEGSKRSKIAKDVASACQPCPRITLIAWDGRLRWPPPPLNDDRLTENEDCDRTVINDRWNPGQHHHLTTHIEEHRIDVKCLIASELVRFNVRRWNGPLRFPSVLLPKVSAPRIVP